MKLFLLLLISLNSKADMDLIGPCRGFRAYTLIIQHKIDKHHYGAVFEFQGDPVILETTSTEFDSTGRVKEMAAGHGIQSTGMKTMQNEDGFDVTVFKYRECKVKVKK